MSSTGTIVALTFAYCLAGCCAPSPHAWFRQEHEGTKFILSRIEPKDSRLAYYFESPLVPPTKRDAHWCNGEPADVVTFLPSDRWVPVFRLSSFEVLASTEYNIRQCDYLWEAFGKSRPSNVCPTAGAFYSYRDMCVRDRDYMLVIDSNKRVVGWSRLGSRYDCGEPRNPYPVASEEWKGIVSVIEMPNNALERTVNQRGAQLERPTNSTPHLCEAAPWPTAQPDR